MSRSTPDRSASPTPGGRRPSRNVVVSLVVVGIFAAVVAVIVGLAGAGGDEAPADASGTASIAARPDSHRLSTAPGSTVDFVEFLDFECESCRAAYPAVEQLRAEYGDRVDFVLRYFPLPSHFNAERAARAVESAAQQGQLEAMYSLMFETQDSWGEQQVPLDDLFRGFAEQIGLDMARFDAAYHDPATLERVLADRTDGLTLGVQGTPTFFVNGERVQVQSYDDLVRALDDALAESGRR